MYFGALIVGGGVISLNGGTFNKTAAPSGGNVTSDTVTPLVPGGSGTLKISGFSFSGTVLTQFSKNAAAFSALVDGDTIGLVPGDTLALRGTGMTAGESWTFTVLDNVRGVSLGTFSIIAS